MRRKISQVPNRQANRTKYQAAQLSRDTRNTIANIYVSAKANGVTPKKMRKILFDAGYELSESTIRTWEGRVQKGMIAVDVQHTGTRPPALATQQRDLLVGYVLDKNSNNQQVDGKAATKWIHSTFGITIGASTTWRYLRDAGFTSQLAKTKGKGYTKTDEELATELWNWLKQRRAAKQTKGLMASFDFTFTSHRKDRLHTFAPQGGGQPKLQDVTSRFTNCILTCEWSDGVDRTPALLFTYNQEFRFDRKGTPRRREQVKHLERCLSKFGVSKDQVVYVGKNIGEKRTYVSESAQLVHRFVEHYGAEVFADHVIFSDNGNAFREGGGSTLCNLGIENHVFYPADVHQFLSPNDNKLHGVAKQKWRHSGVEFQDDVKASIRLLSHLGEVCESTRKSWWEKNFMLKGKADVKRALRIIRENKTSDHKYFQNCHRKFKQSMQQGS